MANEDGLFWERLENEPETAYAAFCVYRDMGLTRSLRKAAATFYGDRQDSQEATVEPPESGTESQLTRFKRWSRTWMWTARCEAHDAELDRERRLKLRERREKMLEEHFLVGHLALRRAAERLQNLGLSGEEIPLKSVSALLRCAADLQRLAVGEPTTSVDLRGMRPREEDADDGWLDGLSLEDREELCRLTGYLDDEDYDPGVDLDQEDQGQ